MPGHAPSPTPTPTTYAQLRDAVVAVVIQGRRQIDRAWLETYHETGRLINEHILRWRGRADYGAGVYQRLAADTGVSVRTLRECAQFHRCFPIRRTCAELEWSKCRLLCQVADDAQRTRLMQQTLRHGWTAMELETRVRTVNAPATGANGDSLVRAPELLTPRRGTPGLHPIVDRGSGPEIDLGFRFYRTLDSAAKFAGTDIVRLYEEGVLRVENATRDQLFTYAATLRKIVDGDTVVVALAVAPGFTHELKLRLRGLDCPELSTAAGRTARAFVAALMSEGDTVVISTTKPDKYDRYLADVFVTAAKEASPSPPGPGLFLNNALLEAGHAIRYGGGAKEE